MSETGGEENLLNLDLHSSSDASSTSEPEKLPRGYQSGADFQRQKETWKPKIEDGELWKTFKLPINNPSKVESQTILHAVEELYFFGRYDEALKVVRDAMKGEVMEEFRRVLEDYRARCARRLGAL